MSQDYKAILILSFGGPEGPDEVMPFLENVLRGKNVPRDRLLEVAEHYRLFGGVSPINGQNRALVAALKKELASHDIALPIYWGNRNWHPMLSDTLARMRDDGIDRALAIVTSAHSSYSGCRQYREDIQKARQATGVGAPEVDKIRVYFNHPGFIEASRARLEDALKRFAPDRRQHAKVLFTAHSIPTSMAEGCLYEAQLLETARLVAEAARRSQWRLAYQSRSGPPAQPWLEPDILDVLRDEKSRGVCEVVIAPIGFVSDHMEVIYDLDTEARDVCAEIGLSMERAGTVGTHPEIVAMFRELVQERLSSQVKPRALGKLGLLPEQCSPDCCRWAPRRPGVQAGRES